ncbi:MAG TPA: diguanylate cyclase [Burkholderiales bacterium]|nr:diguanylate cyclase [Burkholderiales bacterium]
MPGAPATLADRPERPGYDAPDAWQPPPEPPAFSSRGREEGLAFARRMHGPRTLGLGLGFFCVASVLYQHGANPVTWAALAFNGFLWPHVARLIANRSRDPYRAELRNLVADSGAGGAWVALMGFNLLPSALLVAMLSMDKISAGGFRFFARTAAVQVACCAAAVLAFGFDFRPTTTMLNVVGSLPLLLAYPLAVGVATYRLSRRVREQNRMLAALSRTDGLSGLLNRIAWEQIAYTEMARCRRSRQASSLLMLDIDHFKRINDQHGHPAGDEVIRSVAAILGRTVRASDVPGRYGGEEFAVVLPDTDEHGGGIIAERIRRRIETATMGREVVLQCTVSIGVAQAEPESEDAGDWIARADRALYEAKRLGRNRVVRDGAALA